MYYVGFGNSIFHRVVEATHLKNKARQKLTSSETLTGIGTKYI
jgi:hypothetical protein